MTLNVSHPDSDLTELQAYRQQYPALSGKSYFNFGGQGPMAQVTMTAIAQTQAHLQQIGPFSNATNQWLGYDLAQTRRAIADELGVGPNTITLTESVMQGCNIPLWGVDWKPDDHVLVSDCEYPAVFAVLNELQHRFNIKISTCPLMDTLNGGDPISVVQSHLRPTTRMVVISHILWNTGQVLPLKGITDICRTYPQASQPILIHVDAAQSVGVLPLDLKHMGIDFYAFTGHKWLCGPAGLGGLYVRPETRDHIRPTFMGWRGITKNENGNAEAWETDGRRFELSTSDFTLGRGLREAIALHQQWGSIEERYKRVCQLSHRLWQQLTDIPKIRCLRTAPPEAGLVSFTIQETSHKDFVHALEARQFMVRTILNPDCIRACVHYFTLESEIDALAATVRLLLD